MTLSAASVWRVLWLVFSHCHPCRWTHSFLPLRDVGWNYVHLRSISSWHFCFLFLGRCSICAQNAPVIVRRCDITVTSPLISVFLSRVRLLYSSASVWQRFVPYFLHTVTMKYIHLLPLHILAKVSCIFELSYWEDCVFLSLQWLLVIKSVFESILTSKVGGCKNRNVKRSCIASQLTTARLDSFVYLKWEYI